MSRRLALALSAAALLGALGSAPALAQHSSTITYQGALQHEGAPYTGTADFSFRLWNAEVDGQVASPILFGDAMEVDEGLFQIPLEFNAEHLQGDRWMVISVRTPAWDGVGSAPPYTQLPGRQRITASPYSVQTRGVFVNEAGDRVGIGTDDPEATLHVAGKVRADEGVEFAGGALNDLLTRTFTGNFGPIGPNVGALFNISLPGAMPGDILLHGIEPLPSELQLLSVRIDGPGHVQALFRNVSGGVYDAPPMTIKLIAFKQ